MVPIALATHSRGARRCLTSAFCLGAAGAGSTAAPSLAAAAHLPRRTGSAT